MSKSAKARVGDVLAKESHQLREQKIHKIPASMEALVFRAEMVSPTERRQCQVRRITAWRAETTWSDRVRQK